MSQSDASGHRGFWRFVPQVLNTIARAVLYWYHVDLLVVVTNLNILSTFDIDAPWIVAVCVKLLTVYTWVSIGGVGLTPMENISCCFLLKCLLVPGGADISLSTLLIWFSLKWITMVVMPTILQSRAETQGCSWHNFQILLRNTNIL